MNEIRMKGSTKLKIAIGTVLLMFSSYKIYNSVYLEKAIATIILLWLVREFFALWDMFICYVDNLKLEKSTKYSLLYWICQLWQFIMKQADKHLSE